MYQQIVDFIRELYNNKEGFVPLHEPRFLGNEKKYLNECIDSGFVSSVGQFVNRFEKEIAKFCGSKCAIATTNGTMALHAALHALDVNQECEVITQPLTFVATSNAIAYTGARPIYIDVDVDTMGMSPEALNKFLNEKCVVVDGCAINKQTKKIVKACVPMHTFGHPVRIVEIQKICKEWNINLIEDAAESLGSFVIANNQKIHTGNFGVCGILSFNGNKTITSGGGGIILTNDLKLAEKLKHITTTAKIPHPYEYNHDMLGFNYRLPNINAALGVAQLEQIQLYLDDKRKIALSYKKFFESNFKEIKFINERKDTLVNFWLNAIMMEDKKQRDEFLKFSNTNGVMTRPIWGLNNQSPMYRECEHDSLRNAQFLSDRIINIPSSARAIHNE